MKDEPAFPCMLESVNLDSQGGSVEIPMSGLTKREWFAGMAMQGMLTTLDWDAAKCMPTNIAQNAYKMADAMVIDSE